MKLEDIGFYTLSDYRASQISESSPLWRCELLITSRCNFNCDYCRKRNSPDISLKEAKSILDYWASENLKNIRFSGGEPTLHKDLLEIIKYAKMLGIERIAISTNGSASLEYYQQLLDAGVNDFSISLDSCCSSTGNDIAGKKVWEHVIETITYLSERTYVTVGVVLFDKNIDELEEIIKLASSLGVSDIRIISAAQWNKLLDIKQFECYKYPILQYRLNNIANKRNVRGIKETDNPRCPLVIDDMAVEDNLHYPCIIYLRERGKPIGKIGKDTRKKRKEWFENHDCFNDEICKNNCLDVCVDYNNKVRDLL